MGKPGLMEHAGGYAHNWVRSTLGHGETMCTKCCVTNREAAVLGMDECDVADPLPKPANGNEQK